MEMSDMKEEPGWDEGYTYKILVAFNPDDEYHCTLPLMEMQSEHIKTEDGGEIYATVFRESEYTPEQAKDIPWYFFVEVPMLLKLLIKETPEQEYLYVGTTWGDIELSGTGASIGKYVAENDFNKPLIPEKFTHVYKCYFVRDGDVYYREKDSSEKVLKAVS